MASGKVVSGQFKKVASRLHLERGIMYFDQRIVVPKEVQQEVLAKTQAAAHFGQAKTMQLLKRKYLGMKMARDTKIFCRSCITCQKSKPSHMAKVPLQEFQRHNIGPGEFVAMDIATLPWTDTEYRYFLLIVDIFSRYVEALPLRDQTASSLVNEFKNGWVYRGRGVPRVLLSDQAKNIDGAEIRIMCDQLGIEKWHTTPYHPQADGLAERSIGWIKQVARCLMADRKLDKRSWPGLLPEITFYCNNVENESTKFSPQMLCFGRQPTSPVEASIEQHESGRMQSPSEYLNNLKKMREELFRLAREKDLESQGRAKRQYDKNKRNSPVREGDLIFVLNETRSDGLEPKFDGPFKVLRRRGVTVKVNVGRRVKWIHLNRCKPYLVGNYAGTLARNEKGGEVTSDAEVLIRVSEDDGNCETSKAEATGPRQELGPQREFHTGSPAASAESGRERRYPLRERKPNRRYFDESDNASESIQDKGSTP